jgi:uncharacterized membrane protein (UPF0127 family)
VIGWVILFATVTPGFFFLYEANKRRRVWSVELKITIDIPFFKDNFVIHSLVVHSDAKSSS